MCGIWTRARFKGRVELEELLEPIARLRHRGPDGYGCYNDGKVGLVHTRLSIIDIEGGAQPLESFDKRWVGIVNGELYDHEAIRSDLAKSGVRFSTRSDSEVLLNLFAKRGAGALADVSGEFAFIFYDRVERRICFGRDPFGVKPLFIERTPDTVTLASEMKALSSESPVFDPEYMHMFLARMMVPPRTCLKNVEHVLPGRIYTLDLAGRRIYSELYCEPPMFQPRTLALEEAREKLDFELRASVQRRLRADVDVGCYLSGGIDSAVIAAIAADLGARPKAFTVGFADRDFDESVPAGAIASDLGIEHSIVQMTSKNFMDSLIKSIVAFENPITNVHGAAKNLLSAHASQHVKVVLSGEGADELFGGYSYLRMQKLNGFLARHPKLAPNAASIYFQREAEMSLRHLDGDSEQFEALAATVFNGSSPALFSRLVRSRWYEYMTGKKLRPLVEDICRDLSERVRAEHPSFQFSKFDLNLWTGLRTDLLHYVLANVGDRQEMSNAIEGRTPFLDRRVADVAARIQERHLIRGLKEKYVLRRVGAKYLGASHHRRGKKPFFAPMRYLFQRENRGLVDEYVRRSKSATPWLDWKRIDHVVFNPKRSMQSPIEPGVVALKMALFSVGVLTEHLRAAQDVPRGFQLPKAPSELREHRRNEPERELTL